MYPKLCDVSRVSLVENIYGVSFDIVKFLNLWVYLHCYVLSLLQQIYPTLLMVDLFTVPEQWFTISYDATKL